MTQVICANCEHHRERRVKFNGNAHTVHECVGVRNIVTGEVVVSQCIAQRSKAGACGPTGKLFAEKAKALEPAE